MSTVLRILPELRKAAATGVAIFGVFSAFWTTVTFHLTGAPFHLASGVVGLFGLVGIVGTSLSPWWDGWPAVFRRIDWCRSTLGSWVSPPWSWPLVALVFGAWWPVLSCWTEERRAGTWQIVPGLRRGG